MELIFIIGLAFWLPMIYLKLDSILNEFKKFNKIKDDNK